MLAAVAVGAHPDIATGAARMVQVRADARHGNRAIVASDPALVSFQRARRWCDSNLNLGSASSLPDSGQPTTWQVERVVEPDMNAHAAYAPFFEAYRALYAAAKPISEMAAAGAAAVPPVASGGGATTA